MSKPMIRIHNAETNEVIDREMTDEEYTEAIQFSEQTAAELAAKAEAKAALLAQLGITEEQAKLLLS